MLEFFHKKIGFKSAYYCAVISQYYTATYERGPASGWEGGCMSILMYTKEA